MNKDDKRAFCILFALAFMLIAALKLENLELMDKAGLSACQKEGYNDLNQYHHNRKYNKITIYCK